jgi:uroporphyrinogen decarboxylase
MALNARVIGITQHQYTHDVEKMIAAEIEGARNFDFDWVIPFSDDFLEFEPLGVETVDQDNLPVAASKYLSPNWKTIQHLKVPNCKTDGRMPKLLEVQSKLKAILGTTVCQVGHVASPFSAASLIFGVEETLMLILSNPDLLKKTIEFCTELEIQWANAQISAGADAIWLGDCVASSFFISARQFTELAADPAKKVSDAIKKAGGLVFYHSNEHSLEHLKIAAELGFSAINVGEDIDIALVKEAIGKKICLMGNIDPIKVLWHGSKKEIDNEVKRITTAAGKNGGFIFNTGEGIIAQSPQENIRTMIHAVRKYGNFVPHRIK